MLFVTKSNLTLTQISNWLQFFFSTKTTPIVQPSTVMDKNIEANDKFCGKVAFLSIRKWLILGQNKSHIEDWALGNHPHNTSHVTHLT